MKIRDYYLDLIDGGKEGITAAIANSFLWFLSLLYGAVVILRNFLYDKNFILSQKNFDIKVISVGNITWGGTGKTPLSILLAGLFSSEKKTAVLTRGYGKDETELLKEELSPFSVKVFADKDRNRVLEKICQEYDLAVLDDGFQYRKLRRDLDILLVNGKRPFGNKHLIPRGSLREPLKGIKRAGAALITHTGYNPGVEDELKSLNPAIKIFYGRYELEDIRDFSGRVFPLENFKSKKSASFSAIGYPQGFIDLLRQSGIETAKDFVYPDHYSLSEKEFRRIENECLSKGIECLIMTAKDKPRFTPLDSKHLTGFIFSSRIGLFVFKVSLKINYQEEFLTHIRKCIGC